MKKRGVYLSFIPLYSLIIFGLLLAAFAGSEAISVFSQNRPIDHNSCVIIDAGHGGVDGGATSCTGVLESALNLEISLRLDDLLHFLGINTTMIRTTDESVYTQGQTIAQKKVSDLKQRVKIVNETENALLISIHQNHFSDSRYSGMQVFYAATQGSEEFAKELQATAVSALDPTSKRKTKKADGIYLMQKITTPGVLIECGFLSNPEEEAKLRSTEYQQKLCCVIATVTSQYLNQKPIA